MTHFTRPTGVGFDGYVDRTGVGLRAVYVPLHEWREVNLEGGFDSGGKPLVVTPTDPTSRACPIGFTEMNATSGKRRFRFSAVYNGGTTIQVLQGASTASTRQVLDSVEVTVINPAPVVARQQLKFGRNGPIPQALQPMLREAFEAAWALSKKPGFVEIFRKTVAGLSGTEQRSSIYAESLNRSVFNLLDTTTDQAVLRGVADEQIDVQDGAVSGAAPSYSFRNKPNVWIRKSAFDKGVKQLTSCILHEAAHIAGAPGDTVAEWALEAVQRAAGHPR